MYTVYILFSDTALKFYTGQTHDFVNRLSEHNSGQTKSTRHGIPWRLIWNEQVEGRSVALQLERKIKARGAARFLIDRDIAWR